ncbi:MAG: hypothetical protein HQK53_17840 [Oligoflexia bacterium]|nr:hypothetical protein [Oligoflexia bacterium]
MIFEKHHSVLDQERTDTKPCQRIKDLLKARLEQFGIKITEEKTFISELKRSKLKQVEKRKRAVDFSGFPGT